MTGRLPILSPQPLSLAGLQLGRGLFCSWVLLSLSLSGLAAHPFLPKPDQLHKEQVSEKPVWPTEFSAPFGLYSVFPVINNASSTIFYKYDEELQVQMIDYHTKCFPFLSVGSLLFGNPCKLYFQPSGIYLHQPGRDINCCRLVADVGAVPPNFLRAFNLTASNVVKKDLWNRDVMCDEWSADEGFKYWTVGKGDKTYPNSPGHDIIFQDGPTGVTWRWGFLNVSPQDPGIFTLPADLATCNKDCSWLLSRGAKESALASPHVKMALQHHSSGQSESNPWRDWASSKGSRCKALEDPSSCKAASGCQWCVTIDLEWCQSAKKQCKE